MPSKRAETKNDFKKAKEVVYRLLKIRLYSEGEIRTKLKQKKFLNEIIEQTITYFKKLEFIDDRAFAKRWISARLAKPYGASRIRFELQTKGVAKEIIQEELEDKLKDFPESTVVEDLAKRRVAYYKNVDPIKARQRVYGYLARRGFSSDAIRKAVNRL